MVPSRKLRSSWNKNRSRDRLLSRLFPNRIQHKSGFSIFLFCIFVRVGTPTRTKIQNRKKTVDFCFCSNLTLASSMERYNIVISIGRSLFYFLNLFLLDFSAIFFLRIARISSSRCVAFRPETENVGALFLNCRSRHIATDGRHLVFKPSSIW